MNKFIEVIDTSGRKHLINLDWVEEIYETVCGCCIYFAFSIPDAIDQDSIETNEGYNSIVARISEVYQ